MAIYMKIKCLFIAPIVSILILSNGVHAQSTSANLNQIELIKQFAGNWRAQTGKDSTVFWEIKFNGKGLDCNFKYFAQEKVFLEGKQLWEYDNRADKFLLTSMTGALGSMPSSLWFTDKKICIFIATADADNPDNAMFKIESEFKSPDTFIQKTIVNNTVSNIVSYHRVKP
jgi:hypothetical protein